MGAVFLLLALLAVAAVIFWPGLPSERTAEVPPSRPQPPIPSTSTPSLPPAGLDGLIVRFLTDRRLEVLPGKEGIDRVVQVPPGRSLFAVNGELTRAVRLWGGQVVAARESGGGSGGARQVDLRVERQGEASRVRLMAADPPSRNPVLALVVDDFGYQPARMIDAFLRLPFPFTPAVLPQQDRSALAVRRSRESGRRPILHLPVEPVDRQANDPGPGALMVGMGPIEIQALVREHLTDLEGVVGVNHHMGSRGTAEPALVRSALDPIAERGLFYLDSATSDSSAIPALAAQRGVRCLTADLFLDGDPDPTAASMLESLRQARELARANGDAIVIAHARPATLRFLEAIPDTLAAWGCRPVPLEELLR